MAKVSKTKKYKNVPYQIKIIADNVMNHGYVRYNMKDEILNYYLRKQGIVRRIKIDFKKQIFFDVDNKCEVQIHNCGYLLATEIMYMKTGIPTYWKHADDECTCKRRYVIFVSDLEELFSPNVWTIIRQCEVRENGKWKIVPHDVPVFNIYESPKVKKNTIREMYSMYGMSVKVLADVYDLSLRRIQRVVQDLKEQHKKVKKSRGLRKVHWERSYR